VAVAVVAAAEPAVALVPGPGGPERAAVAPVEVQAVPERVPRAPRAEAQVVVARRPPLRNRMARQNLGPDKFMKQPGSFKGPGFSHCDAIRFYLTRSGAGRASSIRLSENPATSILSIPRT
jgi:hypothetical protein